MQLICIYGDINLPHNNITFDVVIEAKPMSKLAILSEKKSMKEYTYHILSG
jgi:hypothetical protein